MSKDTRKFGGKIFQHRNSYYKKKDRDKFARVLKKAGWKIRTSKTKSKVKGKMFGKTLYNLYSRRKK